MDDTENSEWTSKTDMIPLVDVKRRMASSDIETVGFTHHLAHSLGLDLHGIPDPHLATQPTVRRSG